jgi:hypothetical protein
MTQRSVPTMFPFSNWMTATIFIYLVIMCHYTAYNEFRGMWKTEIMAYFREVFQHNNV